MLFIIVIQYHAIHLNYSSTLLLYHIKGGATLVIMCVNKCNVEVTDFGEQCSLSITPRGHSLIAVLFGNLYIK